MCRRETTRPETARTTIRTNGIHIFFSPRPTGMDLTRAPSADPPSVARPLRRIRRSGRTVGIRDEPTQDRICDPRGKPQRAFLLRRQRRQQRRQAFPADPLAVVEQRLTLRGDADEGSTPIVGVGEPGHQALALQPLDQLGHRRLADSFLGGQRRQPNGPFAAHPVHRKRSRRAQVGAVGQKPHSQVHCLIEKLADAVAGVTRRPAVSPRRIYITRTYVAAIREAFHHFTAISQGCLVMPQSPRAAPAPSLAPSDGQRHDADDPSPR